MDIEKLKLDRENLLKQQRQVEDNWQQVRGAIAYIDQKIAQAEKKTDNTSKEVS